MPPLLSARTCWIAGWVAVLVGALAVFVPFGTLFGDTDSYGYGSDDSLVVVLALSRIGSLLLELGLLLLVAAVIVRHVERPRGGPGAGSEEPGVEPAPRDHVDLDEASGAGIDPEPEPHPGHR